jgi:hypothetical protein
MLSAENGPQDPIGRTVSDLVPCHFVLIRFANGHGVIVMRRDIPTSPLPAVADSLRKVQELGEQTAILDCCAGIGGFSMGVVAATGASVSLAIENDADIGSLYAKLHPASTVVSEGAAYAARNWQVLERRLRLETKKWVILQAGVPCQPFSRLNRCVRESLRPENRYLSPTLNSACTGLRNQTIQESELSSRC